MERFERNFLRQLKRAVRNDRPFTERQRRALSGITRHLIEHGDLDTKLAAIYVTEEMVQADRRALLEAIPPEAQMAALLDLTGWAEPRCSSSAASRVLPSA
jgi:hypothetical protein